MDTPISVSSVIELLSVIGVGIKRAISISKTRKITANRKNRKENGNRAFLLGSKPHSKGDLFSRSTVDRAEIIIEINKTASGTTRAIVSINNIESIHQR